MKNTLKAVAVIVMSLMSLVAFSQQNWDAKKNPTVDAIVSQYSGKYIAPRPALTINDVFPVIGQYESTGNTEAGTVSVAIDEQNKGLIWITGLPQGRIKAMLRKSPAVYKIPEQKTEEGKEVAEGTLIYNKEENTLNIVIGKAYNAEDPASVFTVIPPEKQEATVKVSSKNKSKKPAQLKTFSFTGTKVTAETVSN